jgi:hypothetical protein
VYAAAAGDELVDPVIMVDPFGSASYGLAVVCGLTAHDGTIVYRICVTDKHSRRVEQYGGRIDLRLAVGPRQLRLLILQVG